LTRAALLNRSLNCSGCKFEHDTGGAVMTWADIMGCLRLMLCAYDRKHYKQIYKYSE
jgi:hypothetical protein